MTRAVLLLTLVSTAGYAQSRTIINCIASDQLTQWPRQFGSCSGPTCLPSSGALVALLSGTYDLTLVTTEGVATPEVSRWRIQIVPVDTTLWPSSGFALQRWRPLFVGTRTDVARPTPLDSLRRARFVGRMSDFEMGVDSTTGRLHWRTYPGALDAGLFFSVAQVDSNGFFGRWTGGGIAMAVFRRDTITVGEQERGYYCAQRVR